MSGSNLFIETERLLIRPFKMEDTEPSYTMNLDVEVSRYTGDGGVVSNEELNGESSKMYLETTKNTYLADPQSN
jgi:hypothetical protein